MIIFLFIGILCRPSYNPSIDQKQLIVSGSHDTVLRDDVIDECSIDNLEKLIVNEGIMSIGDNAFQNAKKLFSIDFNSKELDKLGSYCFSGCESLTQITLPEGLTTISRYAFEKCYSLTEVTLPSTLNFIENALSFLDCWSLVRFIMPKNGIFSTNSEQNILICNNNIAYAVPFGVSYITIPSEVTVISDQFACNSLLATLKFSSSTNLQYIGYRAFWNTQITNYNIPEGVTILSTESVGRQATYLHLPSTLKEVGFIFTNQMEIDIASGCTAVKYDNNGLLLSENNSIAFLVPDTLTVLELPKECTEIYIEHIRNNRRITSLSVQDGNNVFFSYNNGLYKSETMELIAFPGNIPSVELHPNCKGIAAYAFATTLIECIQFNTNGFLSIGYASFEQCLNLKSIKFANTMTDINQYAFSSCSNLADVEFSSSLNHLYSYSFQSTMIKKADFSRCTNLKSIDAYAFTNSNVNEVILPTGFNTLNKQIFAGCAKLSKIEIPESCSTIDDECFMNCISLQSIQFLGTPTLSTLSFNLFKGSGLVRIDVPDSVTEIQQGALSGCPYLTDVIFSANSKLETINKGSFVSSNCITKLVLPSSLTNIREQSLNEMYGLQNFEISADSTKYKCKNGVIFMDDFATLVVFPGGKESYKVDEKVTSIASSAFFRCKNLIDLVINKDAQITSIGENTFLGCSKLASIEIPALTNELGVNCFSDCTNLSFVKFGDGSVLKKISSGSFTGCAYLVSVTFGSSSSLEVIGNEAFKDCINLEKFTFPLKLKSILSSAFEGCEKLSDLEISNSNIKEIQSNAFKGCMSISQIVFPPTLQTVESNAFVGCLNLKSTIYCGHNEISGNGLSSLESLHAYVSVNYPSGCENFGGIHAFRILDASCNFPTAQFTADTISYNTLSIVLLFLLTN